MSAKIFFSENAYDNLKHKEIAFVAHLRNEINRLVKEGAIGKSNQQKANPKANVREKCAATKCKHKNVVVTNKDSKFGNCYQCDKVEHYDCVNANAFVIESIQNGFAKYYCTECLMNNPVLGLEVLIENENSAEDIAGIPMDTDLTELLENVEETSAAVIVGDIIEERIIEIGESIQQKEIIKCNDCDFKTKVEKQMNTHKRIKHIDVIRFSCDNCDYNSRTKESLEEHLTSHKKKYKCEECIFDTEIEGKLKEHQDTKHKKSNSIRCEKCNFTTELITELDNHMKVSHTT